MTDFVTRADTAIVIPTHNGIDLTLRLFESLARLEGPPVMVILVDDGSTDGTATQVAEAFPDVVVLPTPEGDLWWSGAVNVGCDFAVQRGAKRILLLNNDNLVPPNLVVELVAAHEEIGGMVSGIQRLAPRDDGPIDDSCGVLDFTHRGIDFRHFTAAEEASGIAHTDWAPGTCVMFSSELYERVGKFDARRFPQYRGDIDFSLRALRLGYPCVTTSATWVYSDPAQSWMSGEGKVPVSAFLRSFWSYRSNHNLRETLRFAFEYCPKRHLPYYLFQNYARWTYAFLKSRLGIKRPTEPTPSAPR
jgi:GT2 family glycosyltransferase